MSPSSTHFPGVTLLITHYNRSSSLARLLKTFKELNCTFDEIIVSDDGSKPEHLNAIHNLNTQYDFRLVTTPKNKGLANNLNKGQDAVKSPYTLYVQEDFIPKPAFATHFRNALDMMNEDKKLDIVRFYAYFPYPYLEPYKNGFSKMLYKPWYGDYNKIYYYSDHPHLRRSNFLQKFGRYVEGIKSDKTEYRMCISFIKNKGKGLFLTDFNAMFEQKNSEDEPSTVTRSNWRHQNTNFFVVWGRALYRQIKYNFDLNF
ncbi:glycosyl transferase family 2 [Larkinella arboricola]|uniref:Glycosyl transferase family 2 n=1 Tax=Larkinella arboricola TaxID=643671 RepID=A0A327WPW8_LARAB|nr:glycosyltransferase [Larkinella arboricola]RAJ93979.1 glycosyl transferase family 2 [Larkinella arboricola]